jgi:hypothetical protein
MFSLYSSAFSFFKNRLLSSLFMMLPFHGLPPSAENPTSNSTALKKVINVFQFQLIGLGEE